MKRKIERGDIIQFTDKYGDVKRGTVVRTPIGGDWSVYVEEGYGLGSPVVYGIMAFRTIDQPDSWKRGLNLARAAWHYRQHLAQFPVWRERFAANPRYPVFI
jgi:hypothetical protein